MSDETENTEATEAPEVVEEAAPVSDIEAAANAAAEAEPEPAPEPEPEATPEPEPEAAAPAKKAGAKATTRTKRKPRKKDPTTATIQNHLAKLKENRTLNEAPEPTAEEIEADKANAKKRERLDEILVELAELDEARAALIAEQESLAATQQVEDNRTFHEKLKATQERAVEIRKQRQRDRLTLLAAGAGKSPLDQALGSRPRNRPDLESDPAPSTE